jgi:hypothetical protein
MSDKWRRNILVPIFKNKKDIQSYTNYRDIKLISYTMKLWEKLIDNHLGKLTIVSKKISLFYAWEDHHGGDFLDKIINGEISRTKNDLYMIFIDLEKAYDKILKNIMWGALEKKLVPTK